MGIDKLLEGFDYEEQAMLLKQVLRAVELEDQAKLAILDTLEQEKTKYRIFRELRDKHYGA